MNQQLDSNSSFSKDTRQETLIPFWSQFNESLFTRALYVPLSVFELNFAQRVLSCLLFANCFSHIISKKTLIDKFLIFFESLLACNFTPFVYSCSSALSSVWFSEASASADWFVESLWCRNILIVQHSNGLHSTAVFYFSQLFLFSFRYNHFRGSRYGYPPPPHSNCNCNCNCNCNSLRWP